MSLYSQVFIKEFIKEDVAPGVPAPSPAPMQNAPQNDEEVWASQNPKIVDNPALAKQFNTEGIPEEVIQRYSEKIGSWKEGIVKTSQKFEEIYDFATKNAETPGADKMFSEIGEIVESILTNLGTLEGKLKFLDKKINLAVSKENKKQSKNIER